MIGLSLILLLLLPFAAAADETASIDKIATIRIKQIDEASGLARSQRNSDVFWTMNDDGEPRLYAFDTKGKRRGRLTLDPASNRDWEDLSSFLLDGKAFLLVADFGDNMGRRDSVTIYVVEEPDLGADDKVRSKPAWTIEYRYPDGPRDAESVAVDTDSKQILILSKRDRPPRLYSLPLRPDEGIQTAKYLGQVKALPRPSRADIELAPKTNNWWWQPSAMDIHRDLGVIMTYQGIFFYRRDGDEDWLQTFNRRGCAVALGKQKNAESVVIAGDGESVFATVEKKNPPLLEARVPEKTCHED